jgi:hypothetical protein
MSVLSLREIEQSLKVADPQKRHEKLRTGGIALICKSLRLPPSVFDSMLHPAKHRNGLTKSEIEQSHRGFLEIARAAAKRIGRFWQLRQSIAVG